MNKAIEILEAEIAELQEAVDKLKEGQPWECKSKPDNEETRKVKVVSGANYIFFESDYNTYHFENDGKLLVINL